MTKPSLLLATCLALGACATPGGADKAQSGTAKPDAGVATILPPAGKGSMVLYIDGVKTSNCTFGCAFDGPVKVPAGQHNFHTSNYDLPDAPPRDLAAVPEFASEGTDVSLTLADNTYAFSFDSTLEAGKRYRLQFAVARKDGGQSMPHMWWQEEKGKLTTGPR
ncbi:MAG TPA: hypothetical protein VHB46_04590 [Burkholderiales bacterium]|nr:hypothetical protein [Burkholderiales bacterium]